MPGDQPGERWPLVAVVGATGAVGREALAILADRGHPADRVIALASARSAGQRLAYGETEVEVVALGEGFPECDAALFCASAEIARSHARLAVDAGALVVDNSSAFRMDPAVPLVVPEINGHTIGNARLIANPNCSTIILLTALNPLRERFGVERVVVSTYQAVSGAGIEAVEELKAQARAVLDGKPAECRVFPRPCAFNVFSHESAVDPATGLNGEEAKMIAESRRIWPESGGEFELIPTCVRVPVVRAHTQSAVVTLGRDATEAAVLEALATAAGLRVVEDRARNEFPTPLAATGGDDVLVGRVRRFGERTVGLLIAGDQLRKGAAGNAVQVMDWGVGGERD